MKPTKPKRAKASSIVRGTPARSLLELQTFILYKLGQFVQEKADQSLVGVGVKARHFGILHLLVEEGPHSQQALCESAWIDRGTMVSLIDELEKQGLVKRGKNPEDARSYLISPTREGAQFHARHLPEFRRLERELFPSLQGQHRKEAEIFRKVLRNLMLDVRDPKSR